MFSDDVMMNLISKLNEVRRSVKKEKAKIDQIGMALLQQLHPSKDLKAELEAEVARAKEYILSDTPRSFGWEPD